MRFTVTIDEVGSKGRFYIWRVNVPREENALGRALTKQWGVGACWQPDSDLKGYGQVFKSMAALGYKGDHGFTSRTGRARLQISPGWNI